MKQHDGVPPPPHPDCGRRLLPVVIDEIAQNDPSRPWVYLPIDDWDLSLGCLCQGSSTAEFCPRTYVGS